MQSTWLDLSFVDVGLMLRCAGMSRSSYSMTALCPHGCAGARYQVELCRQLADFLIKPLQQAGGIMTLADVFCLYNR